MEPLHDPIEALPSSRVFISNKTRIIATVLGFLILCSIALNACLCIAHYPKLREDIFIALHRDEMDRLLFQGGVSILEGVIKDEDGDSILVEMPEGNVRFLKMEIKRIERNFYQGVAR